MMPKIKIVICVVLFVLLFSGCASGYCGNDISKLIDPTRFGSVLPKNAPSTELPIEDSAKYGYNASEPNTIYTVDMQWEISGGYFISEEFKFAINTYWRDCFKMAGEMTGSGDINMRTFNFYFVEEDTAIEVRLLRIDVMSVEMAEDVGTLGGDELGRNKDGSYVYIQMPVKIDDSILPEGFHSGREILEIITHINSIYFDFSVIA